MLDLNRYLWNTILTARFGSSKGRMSRVVDPLDSPGQ